MGTKIKITPTQYNMILLREQQERSSSLVISEGIDKVLMGFSNILGIRLTGKNKIEGDAALNNNAILIKIKDVLEDKSRLSSLVDSLEEKGLENPSSRLANDAHKIIVKYNKIATERGLKDLLGLDAETNLKSLDKTLNK